MSITSVSVPFSTAAYRMRSTYYILLSYFLWWSSTNGKAPLDDISIQRYNEMGEITQLVYSNLAIDRDAPVVAYVDVATEAAIILSTYRVKSPLLLSKQRKVEHLKEEGIVTAAIGYVPDCAYARNYLYSIIQNHRLTYGECPSLESIASQMSSWISRCFYTSDQTTIARPLAACVLMMSYEEKRMKLMHIENSGLVTDRKYIVRGALPTAVKNKIIHAMEDNAQNLTTKASEVMRLLLEEEDQDQDVIQCIDFSLITKQNIFIKQNFKDVDQLVSFIETSL